MSLINEGDLRLLRRGLSDDDHDHDNDHDEDKHDDHHDELDVDTFKIIMLIAMILCVGFGVIPKLWSKCRDNENALSFLNCFASGIFLAMALVHMMPES